VAPLTHPEAGGALALQPVQVLQRRPRAVQPKVSNAESSSSLVSPFVKLFFLRQRVIRRERKSLLAEKDRVPREAWMGKKILKGENSGFCNKMLPGLLIGCPVRIRD
jgi:hypothetical protein